MSNDEWLPKTEQPKKAPVATIDRRSLSKLRDRGLVDFQRVCDRMGYSRSRDEYYNRRCRSLVDRDFRYINERKKVGNILSINLPRDCGGLVGGAECAGISHAFSESYSSEPGLNESG
jgi:hypothetical protein